MIEALLTIYRLKDIPRAGWLLRGIREPESVADHSWATAFVCYLYAPLAGADPARSMAIALLHDIAESVTGDLPRRVDPAPDAPSAERKAELERAAFETLFPIGSPRAEEVRALWDEYESDATLDARFARDMNLVDMCLQALLYESEQRYDPVACAQNFPRFNNLDEFFETSRPRMTTEVGRRLFQEIEARYRGLRSEAGRSNL